MVVQARFNKASKFLCMRYFNLQLCILMNQNVLFLTNNGWGGRIRQSFGTYDGSSASRPRVFNATLPLVITPPAPRAIDRAIVLGGTTGFGLYAIAPVLSGGWVLMGEPNKYVGVAFRRFSHVVASATSGLHVSVTGAADERVEVMVTHQSTLEVVTVACSIGSSRHPARLACTTLSTCLCR